MAGKGGTKNPLRDKLDEDVLDLSLMQLENVPVEDIAELTKASSLDLSNNRLTFLPEHFPTLTNIVKLDLSKNELNGLPEYFGQLRNLRHLDLYSNRLERLPVSFAQMKNLKWLDLKNNPLVPALAQAAGPCITASDCAMCAKKVVALLQSMQSQLERERQKVVLEEQRAEASRKALEDQERDKIRAEKRAAKERRREEARSKEGLNGKGSPKAEKYYSASESLSDKPTKFQDGRYCGQSRISWCFSWCWPFFMLTVGLFLVLIALGISLIWIYTNGKLDQRSVEKAMPLLNRDINLGLIKMNSKIENLVNASVVLMGPYFQSIGEQINSLLAEWGKRQKLLAHYINEKIGPYCCSLVQLCKKYYRWLHLCVFDAWDWTKPKMFEFFQKLQPTINWSLEIIIEQSKQTSIWLEKHVPIYIGAAYEAIVNFYDAVYTWANV